jgi:hypothetical protein
MKILGIICICLLVGFTGTAMAHPDSGVTLFAPHVPSGVVTIDASIDDWGWFPEAATITTDQTFPHVCADGNCEVVPEDFDWTIRIAWNDDSNRLLFSVDVFDDIWLIPENAGERSLHNWDGLEIVSDPDNSGGLIGGGVDEDGLIGRYGQQWYYSQGAPGEGTRMEVIYSGADGLAATWPGQPPYGDATFSLDGNRGIYEASMVLWDFLSELGPDDSIAHDLTEGETVGFGFLYDERDVAGGYDAQWKTGESPDQWKSANNVPDLLLLGTPATAVEDFTWGQIKAGLSY